jgi:homoaconitate hydratase
MTTEWGPLVGFFPADASTFAYVRDRMRVLAPRGVVRVREEDVKRWESAPSQADPDAEYAGRIALDLGEVTPHVSGPDTVRIATPLFELEASRIPIQKAYLVSCVNSRASDIEAAASVVRGKRVARSVDLYVAAASKEVQEATERSGAWRALVDAGATPLPSGCGPCIGLGAGLLEAGEVGISATNRNFKGRMGSRDARCYLASPEVVAASALAGYIRGPEDAPRGTRLRPAFEPTAAKATPFTEPVGLLRGFPGRIRGRLVFLPQDDLDTDGIYGKDYTYRDDVDAATMAEVAMANYDPEFRALVRKGDVLVGAYNFGTGSSREQAVTALQAKGIALLVAGSYSHTYLRNAFNNGMLCIVLPSLVDRLRDLLGAEIAAGKKTIVPGDEVEAVFSSSTLAYRGETFAFPALGSVPQSLYVEGGAVNLVRRKLGLARGKT